MTTTEREGASMTLDKRYRVEGYGGIAFYAIGYTTEMTEERWTYLGEEDDPHAGSEDYYALTGDHYPDENPANYIYDPPEEVEDRSRVRVVMVGDDRVITVGVDELVEISEDDYCHECGQIGCTADGRDRA